MATVKRVGPDDLVLCAGTIAARSFREYVEAAGAAGFSGISLWGSDYRRARGEGLSDRDIRTLLDDHGLFVAELDGVVDWLNPLPSRECAGFDLDIPFFGFTEGDFYTIADAIGARSITVVDPFGGTDATSRMAEAFASVCDRAANHGLLVHLEFLSWGAVPNLKIAWEIVQLANRNNGGIVVDTLHLFRSDSLHELRQISGAKIFSTQFSDALETPPSNPYEGAANRLLPGQGELNLKEVLRILRQIGSVAPLGAEINSKTLAGLPGHVAAAQVFQSMKVLLT